MTKRNKIIYWISTIWLALGMLSTGIVQLIKMKEDVDKITHLGYPIYILRISEDREKGFQKIVKGDFG